MSQCEAIGAHLKECPECKAELDRIEAVLAALDTMPVPDPGEDYGQRVWKQIASRLPEKRHWWDFGLSKQVASGGSAWSGLFEPRRLVTFAAVAALVVVAFLAGRRVGPDKTVADAANVRERVLIMAVGEHLGRSEMVLVELSNAEPLNAAVSSARTLVSLTKQSHSTGCNCFKYSSSVTRDS